MSDVFERMKRLPPMQETMGCDKPAETEEELYLDDMPPGFVLLRLPRPNRWVDDYPKEHAWLAAIAGKSDDLPVGRYFLDCDLESACSGRTAQEAAEKLRAKLRE